MTEKKLTDEEAKELYELLNKLDNEMHERLEEGDETFDTEEVSFTTIMRDKKRRYLEEVYDVKIEN